MDVQSLRERMLLVLAQADAENGGNATNEQRVDALLNVIGLAKTPERVSRTVSNPRFGKPGEFPKIDQEAATLSDLVAHLIQTLAAEGDLPLVVRGFDPYEEGYLESAVWRRTDPNVKNPESAQFDWSEVVYEVGPTYGRVDGLPGDVRAINLQT